jgi:hypothetical protein
VEKWVYKIHRMSLGQLKALEVLALSKDGIIEANDSVEEVGLKGKSLGGIFSSLSRQKIGNESLILAWGRAEGGRGLRWKLNTKLINQEELRKVIKEILII